MIVNQIQSLGGANASLSPLMQPENSPTVLNGVNPAYKLGALLKDTGYSQVGDTIETGKDITGLFDFHQSPTVQKLLATVNNAGDTNLVLAYNNAGTWTDIALSNAWDAYEDCKVEMEDFIGYCFFVGYDATDDVFLPVGSLTGTTFSTSTNVTGMPPAKFIVRYRDRLYVAHLYYSATLHPYRVAFSSVPSAGAITWTIASDFLDVDYGGGGITGMGTNWDRLMVFTENTAYIYDQTIWKQIWDTGCSAHRTIQSKGPFMYWCDYDNFWRSSGGQPEPIGGPVIDFIRAGSPREFFSCIVDEEYRTYVGAVTVNGVSYSNCEVVFNFPTQTWRWREYHDDFTVYAKYNDDGTIRQYMGAADGEVMNKGKYTDSTLVSSDDGNAISANFELAPMWLNSETMKRIKKIIAYADRAQGLKLKARVLDRNTRVLTPYKPLGELTKYINEFDANVDKGVFIQIAGSESGSFDYFSFLGVQIDMEPYSRTPKR